MNWHTANKRKRRALARQRVPRKHSLFTPGWRKWLDKVLPEIARWKMAQNFIYEDSVVARIMRGEFSGHSMSISGRRGRVPMVLIVDDDIDFSKPAIPQPTKEFIYGDWWIAFRRHGNGR